MRRPSYDHIIKWKERRGDQARPGMALVHQIDSLCSGASIEAISTSEFLQFIPIRLVTLLEVFLRDVIAELVDGGDEYFQQAEKLVKGAKFDFAFAAHVNRHELTIGDFVAHAVSLNRVDAVFSALGTLLDGYSAKLKVAHPRWTEERDDWPLPPIIDDYDTMVASLDRLYEVRHILAHEMPQTSIFKPEEVQEFAAAAKAFITATDWVVVEVLHGAVPRTQAAMTESSGNDLILEEKRLAEVLSDVATLDGIDMDSLRALQNDWEKWADAQAALVASQVEGGSMQPMIWASEKMVLTRERIDQLVRLRDEWMQF